MNLNSPEGEGFLLLNFVMHVNFIFNAIKSNVGEQRANNSPLRSSAIGFIKHTFSNIARFEPAVDQDSSWEISYFVHQEIVAYIVETAGNVGVQHPALSWYIVGCGSEILKYTFQCIVTRATWTKSIATNIRVVFPFWFQRIFVDCLYYSVYDGGDSQRSKFSIWFSQVSASGRQGFPPKYIDIMANQQEKPVTVFLSFDEKRIRSSGLAAFIQLSNSTSCPQQIVITENGLFLQTSELQMLAESFRPRRGVKPSCCDENTISQVLNVPSCFSPIDVVPIL
eukprot:TRINITY_DN2391_c0_g2_i4.p2 TRINITY_DN2391_c0_g2~~TRINITY_DN2391_c0_g2_i4.p2  ORF type:complete len:281 (+),score=3.50 TRINITY_DN2391_c0_g2_i4:1201-2043(+)